MLEAPTKAELRRLAYEWMKEAKAMGLQDIRVGYRSDRVEVTENGYAILVSAHS